jgi:hypothetical protein
MTTVRIDIDGQMRGSLTTVMDKEFAVQPTMPGALIGPMSETDWKAWVESVNVAFAPLNEVKSKYFPYRKWFWLAAVPMLILAGLATFGPLQTCKHEKLGRTSKTATENCYPNYILIGFAVSAAFALFFGPEFFFGRMLHKRAFACLEAVKKICEQESQKHANMTFIVKEDVAGTGKHMVRTMYIEVSVVGTASTSPVQPLVQAEAWQLPGEVGATPPAETEDIPEKLAKLKKMLDSGLINEEDYENKKAELLEKM